jgi:hypothetical protein
MKDAEQLIHKISGLGYQTIKSRYPWMVKLINQIRKETIEECAEQVVIDGNTESAKKRILQLIENLK